MKTWCFSWFLLSFLFTTGVAQPVLKIGGLPPEAVFIGIDNPVTLEGNWPKGKTPVLGGTGFSEIKKTGEYSWRIRCARPGQGKLVLLSNSGDTLLQLVLPVKGIGDKLLLKFTHGLMLPPKTIAPGLVPKLQGLAYVNDVPWLRDATGIVGFTFTWVRRGEDPFEQVVRGDTFTAGIRQVLARVRAGDVIFLDDVKCFAPGDCSCTRHLENIRLEIR